MTDPAMLRSLSVLGPYSRFIASAPAAIIPVMDAGGDVLRAFDCGRVTQTMTLAAHALGLGSCVAAIGAGDDQRVAASILGVPEGHEVWVAVGLGYPRTVNQGPANRKSLRELVHVEAFGRLGADLAEPHPIGAAAREERRG